ncbi:oxygen-regulated protein 1-like [Betta splendens]|uniref:Oxygen-regulated protein 1-like n=1 Tax=Betta splendens TaxID=158456 RepID=A0A9W2XRX2_BETSP|nr:oxygen-regulated protein 1-like [Betta splendens]
MMNETGLRRLLPDQSSGSGHTVGTSRHPGITDPILSKRVCFYKSGDPQFNGLRMVINKRTFKTFDALLDSLSKKVPLPFGVRNITTPRGVHAVYTLDELEDGKSYICSDRRKVKPINLAVARKKLPPWYHARPVSSRRRTVQQARFHAHKQEAAAVRTPKRLLVFRNGDPAAKQTVVLHRRTAPTFESVLQHISQLIQFHVVKLHTVDGRRVDSLPGLILCSGAVVAAGREPFRPADYNAQKSPGPTRLPTNRMGLRRLKASNRKKKSLSNLLKMRHFSPSSERYIVNRIRNSIAESSGNILSNPTNSDELESAHVLESVAETEEEPGADALLPTEDDIEKSFRVNQDGSMTVEMRVRLTLKEEETIHWTTTLTRSSAAGQPNDACLPEQEAELEAQTPLASVDAATEDRNNNNNDDDDDPTSLSNGVLHDSSNEEDRVKAQKDAGSPMRAPTPGREQIRRQQTPVESIKSVTGRRIQEGVVGSYSYRETMENGATTEQYCVLKQSTTRPVPKPRRLGSVDANPENSRDVSSFRSAEILQIQSGHEEITESVLHIYEQQSCQDNFLANICARGVSAAAVPFDRPATSDTGHLSSKSEFQPEFRRPRTASESMSNWRAESLSSDFTPPSLTGTTQRTNRQQPLPRTTKGNDVAVKGSKDKRAFIKAKVVNKRVRPVMPSGKRQKEKRTKVKTFSSAGFIRRIYGKKPKSAKRRPKKKLTHGAGDGVGTKSSQTLGDRVKSSFNGPDVPQEKNTRDPSSPETSQMNVSQQKGKLTRQASLHQEKEIQNEPLPGFNSSSCVANEYVEEWLKRSHPHPTACSEEALTPLQLENSNDGGLKAEEAKSEIRQSVLESFQGTSVKLRVQSFENKSGQLMEEHSHVDSTNTENCTSVEGIKPISNDICSVEMNPSPVEISAPPSSPDLPLPPPPELLEDGDPSDSECCSRDVSPVLSSPLCQLSSVSSHLPYDHPASDKAASPSDHTTPITSSHTEKTPSLQEPPLPRTPSIKRAPLVSNLSLERKMSLRKACLDKYASCSETSTSCSSMNTRCDKALPNGNGSKIVQEETQKRAVDVMSSLSCCTSEPPTTSTSDERMSSASISSNETPTQKNPSSKETKTPLSQQKEAPSPQTTVKKVKLMESPSTMRKSQTKKLPSDPSPKSSSLHNQPPHKTVSPNVMRKHATANGSLPMYRPKLQKRQSPYSQSLDLASPPVRSKTMRKTMSRNLSSDDASEAPNKAVRKASTQRKSANAAAELDKTPTCENDPLDAGDRTNPTQGCPLANTLALNSDEANMKPVLDKICYSIKSIRQVTQNKRLSCLEKSNSMPDFSSHVASTFGSSSKVLLAFLSVMTLKECLTNFNMDELNANNVSCAEALKMIDSLREIACIEDSQKLKCSLTDLQQSASKQLLRSWKGFQVLSDKCKSRSSTPNCSEHGLVVEASLEKDCGVEENVINEIMDNLDIPERLKEELVSLSAGFKNESEKEGNMSVRILKKLSLNDDRDSSTEDPAPTKDVNPDETANVDVRSIIKRFAEINQAKDTDVVSVSANPETAKNQAAEKATKDRDDENVSAECQTHEVNERETPKEEEESPEGENKEVTKLCMDVVKGHVEDKLNEGREMTEKQDVDKMCSEERMNIPEKELNYNDEGLEEEDIIDLEDQGSCKDGVSGSDASKQQSLEEPELEGEDKHQESSEGDLSNLDSNSEEENKRSSSNYYVELDFSRKETTSSPDSRALSDLQSPFNQETEPEVQKPCIGPNLSVEESTEYSDELCSLEEEQGGVEHKESKVTTEESLSVLEEEQECVEMEEDPDDLVSHEEECEPWTEEYKFDRGHSHNVVGEELSVLIENQALHTEKEKSGLMGSKGYFNAEEDSGNDHSSCGDQEAEQPKDKHQQTSSSVEEELSYYDKESGSEEERDNTRKTAEESCKKSPVMRTESHATQAERAVDQHQCDQTLSQSVAERVSLLEKQVAEAQQRTTSAAPRSLHRPAHLETDAEDWPSASPASQPALCSQSAPQSSLAFRYDSSGTVTAEPDGNRVRSIREMFLAKSAADIQPASRRFPSPNPAELSELRAQTSGSGGYQSQTSSDVSSGEDDSARKSITKGFVRRTIERLYGKKSPNPDEEAGERSLSEPKQKKKEHSSIFSPFHSARSKAGSELSYFSSVTALDTLSEATRCIAFNAQVGPGDGDRWLLSENTLIRKSVSDPVGIHKTSSSAKGEGTCKDTVEDTPYSLFSTKPEQEDKKALSRKCTYFSMPHASDSDACQDEQGAVNDGGAADAKDKPEDAKARAERNTVLPDFKLVDNKVHPLAEVVVVQPGKGQAVVNRRLQEPDVLDLLYNFCGQHCPIL